MQGSQQKFGRNAIGYRAAALLVTCGLMATAPAALAQDADDAKTVTFSGTAAFVSDYRFRGVSLSNEDVAVQPSITMTTAPGFYFNIWGSSIANFNGATTEVDLTAGWSGSLGDFSPSFGIIGYLYPGGTGTDYYELFGSMGYTIGPVGLTVGLNIAPGQDNIVRSNRYLYFSGNVGIPDTPISINANLGFERGGLVPDTTGERSTKTDWLLGVSATFSPITVGLAYTDTDLPSEFTAVPLQGQSANPLAQGAIVVSLSASF